LRTKKGTTGKRIQDITSANDLMCIGFVFANTGASADASLSSAVVSVAEIEERSGFKFFQNLNPAIAAEVKKQKNYSAWGF
jgi:endonuclease G